MKMSEEQDMLTFYCPDFGAHVEQLRTIDFLRDLFDLPVGNTYTWVALNAHAN